MKTIKEAYEDHFCKWVHDDRPWTGFVWYRTACGKCIEVGWGNKTKFPLKCDCGKFVSRRIIREITKIY